MGRNDLEIIIVVIAMNVEDKKEDEDGTSW